MWWAIFPPIYEIKWIPNRHIWVYGHNGRTPHLPDSEEVAGSSPVPLTMAKLRFVHMRMGKTSHLQIFEEQERILICLGSGIRIPKSISRIMHLVFVFRFLLF
jgi:hypothetical protein